MAKKINLDGVKEFLFNHGEKVALGSCAFLALCFGVMGFMDASSAGRSETGKPWAEEIKTRHDEIKRGMDAAQIPKFSADAVNMLDPKLYDWRPISSDYQQMTYINTPEVAENKRQNPRALAALTGPKASQLDYVPKRCSTIPTETNLGRTEVKVLDAGAGPPSCRSGFRAEEGNASQGAGNTTYLRAGDPRRLVVGYAIFPMKDQVIEFQPRSLKYNISQKRNVRTSPAMTVARKLGITLLKFETLPNGQPGLKEPGSAREVGRQKGRDLRTAQEIHERRHVRCEHSAVKALEPFTSIPA